MVGRKGPLIMNIKEKEVKPNPEKRIVYPYPGHHRFLPILAGLCVTLIFGFSFLFSKTALQSLTPFQLLASRFTIAALCITLLVRLKVVRIQLKGKPIASLLILSIVQPILYFLFEAWGLQNAGASEAGIMLSLIPIIVTVLAAVFLKERPSKLQFFFIILSTGGVCYIVIMGGLLNQSPDQPLFSGTLLGYLFLLGAVTSAGFYNILSRKNSIRFRPMEITFVMMWVGMVAFIGMAGIELIVTNGLDQLVAGLSNPITLISILYLGSLSSVMAFFLLNYMLSRLEASRSAIFGNITTIISILAGVLFLGEQLYSFHLIGSILILMGVWGTQVFRKKRADMK